MKHIVILYHSGYGHTKVQAQHVEQGARSVSDVSTTLVTTEEAIQDFSLLEKADAIIFGSPTYMGSVSAQFKAFMDASSSVWMKQLWKDKIAAGFTNSLSLSGDKLNSLIQMAVFAAQHGMIWVGQSELNASPKNEPGKSDVVNRIGSYLGAMAQSENDSPEVTPPSGDLKTAELLGKRVATIAKRFQN